jgi:hypothetical protein
LQRLTSDAPVDHVVETRRRSRDWNLVSNLEPLVGVVTRRGFDQKTRF